MITLDDLVVSGIDGNGNEHIIYYPNKDDPYFSISVSNDHKHQCYWILKHEKKRNGNIKGEILRYKKNETMYPSEFVKWLNEKVAQ